MVIVKTFFDLARAEVEIFQMNNAAWMSVLSTGWQIQEIMILAYRSAIRRNLLVPFEQMPNQEKVWKMVDEISNGQSDPIIRERIAISLITLEFLL